MACFGSLEQSPFRGGATDQIGMVGARLLSRRDREVTSSIEDYETLHLLGRALVSSSLDNKRLTRVLAIETDAGPSFPLA